MKTRSEKIREKQRELIEEREELLEEIEINQKSSRLDREEAEKKKMQRFYIYIYKLVCSEKLFGKLNQYCKRCSYF